MSRGEGYDNFWITPYNTGVFNYSLDGQLISSFSTANSELQDNLTFALAVIGQKLFIGSNSNGIYIVDIPSKRLNTIGYNTRFDPTISGINCFSNGNNPDQFWAGTIDDGMFDLSAVSIRSYNKATSNNGSASDMLGLSSRAVNCTLKDGNKVWVGTDGGGLNRFNPARRTFRQYASTEPLKIVSMAPWSDSELLLSTYAQGLFIFSKRNGKIRPALTQVHNTYMEQSIPTNLITHGDKLYMFGNKCVVYDRKRLKAAIIPLVELPYPSPLLPFAVTDSMAYIISKRALYKIDFATNQIEHIYTPEINGSFIECAELDNHNCVWIGHDSGIICYDLESGESRSNELFTNHSVNAISTISPNELWIGSESVLYRYNTLDNKLQSYNSQIGFAPNAFKHKASCKLNNGDLVMGGGSGIMVIPDGIEPINTKLLNISIDKIVEHGESVDLTQWHQDKDHKLKIPYSNSVQLSLKHDGDNLLFQYKFRYSINGEAAVESSDNILNLGSLSGGRIHHVSVSYLSIDGNWTEPQKLISFVVPNVWYLRWYNILLILIFISAMFLWQLHHYRQAEINQYQTQLNSHFKRISEEKIEFLTNINHELRTPLTLMRAPLLQVVKNLPETSEESRLSKLALKQVMRMKYIVDMVLDIKKIDNGNKILYKTAVNVDEWLTDFANNFEYEAKQHHIAITTTLSQEPKLTMLDRGKMELVVTNLISNAIKFSKENSTIDVQCSISEQECIRICVKDQGIGIKGEPKLLFDAYYQENLNGVGTGLGLSYARSIVELHDGQIGCYNNPDGIGASFFIELPIIACTEEEVNLASPQSKVVESDQEEDFSSYTAVVVEDDPSVSAYVTGELRKRFKTIHVAPNGLEGLQLIRKVKPNIVISDVMMPIMNGYELCQTLKNESDISHIPVILLTAYVGPDNKLTGYKVGADNYITKPFDMEYLIAVIGNILRQRSHALSSSISSSGVIDSKAVTFSAYDEAFVSKINSLVERELSNPDLNVDMIAVAVAMSRTSLYNKMKSVIGVSVRDYIVRARMERARELLKDHNRQIADIATQVGFADQRYFSTTFKQFHKQTPSEYRNSL